MNSGVGVARRDAPEHAEQRGRESRESAALELPRAKRPAASPPRPSARSSLRATSRSASANAANSAAKCFAPGVKPGSPSQAATSAGRVLAGDTTLTYTSAPTASTMKDFEPIPAWQVLSETTLVEQRWLEVREQRVRLANGHEIERFHLIKGPNWAGVLCLTAERDIVFVRQYRHGFGGASRELPAGVLDAAEEPTAAARRELREETGFEAAHLEPLLSVAPEPARNSTRAHFFFARDAARVGAQALDSSEDLEVVLVPASEVLGLIDGGHIVHAAHIAAILLALRRGLL